MKRASAVLFAVSAALFPPIAGRAASATCGGHAATIVGTPGSDVLLGTAGPDVIAALGGNDSVHSGRGADLVCGGAGTDRLRGGVGDDRLLGGRGDDVLEGGRGRDTIAGGLGADACFPGAGGAAPTSCAPLVAAAGDISCDPGYPAYNGGNGTANECRMRATSDLLVGVGLAAVLVLGDAQYEDGALDKFRTAYDASWGRVRSISRPTIGNHDLSDGAGAGYFGYFGAPAGPEPRGYYSFEIGGWHLVALNSNCWAVSGCDAGSPQETWLRQDLAGSPAQCTLAFWHHPRFSSGKHGSNGSVDGLWRALVDDGAEVALSGHDHVYERFSPMDGDGLRDPRGVRQFVAGTGGRSLNPSESRLPNSAVRDGRTFGVLQIALLPGRYVWRFVPAGGVGFTDAGSASCV